MLSSGETLLMEILLANPPQHGPAPYNENDPAVLAARGQHTLNTIKALLEPLTKRRKAAAEKQAAELAAQRDKMAALVDFIAGLRLPYDDAKELLADCVELLAAMRAQVDEAKGIAQTCFTDTEEFVPALYAAHKRHYEVQELLNAIVKRTENAAQAWLLEFKDARTVLPLKMVLQARMAAKMGWQGATSVQWPVVVATYELLVPLAERLRGELVAALAEEELWLGPMKKGKGPVLDGQATANSRGASVAFAKTVEVKLFVKEEVVGEGATKSKTYQVCLTDDQKESRDTIKHAMRIHCAELKKQKQDSMGKPARRTSVSTPARKTSISTPARKTSISTPARKSSRSDSSAHKAGK